MARNRKHFDIDPITLSVYARITWIQMQLEFSQARVRFNQADENEAEWCKWAEARLVELRQYKPAPPLTADAILD